METEFTDKDKTKIWDAFWQTDPSRTKAFSKGGGFRGTAINPTYVKERLTTFFGPAGIGWGYKVIDEELIKGHKETDNQVLVHKVLIEFWYVFGKLRSDPMQAFGQTTMVGMNKNGWFTDEEAPKKSLTDALMKVVSDLGMGADIHAGLYDDCKYLAELKKQFSKTPTIKEENLRREEENLVENFAKEVQATLTKAQQKDFVAHVSDCGVSVETAIELIKAHGYAKTADIPVDKLESLKKELKFISKGVSNVAS